MFKSNGYHLGTLSLALCNTERESCLPLKIFPSCKVLGIASGNTIPLASNIDPGAVTAAKQQHTLQTVELVCINILAECSLQSRPVFSRMIYLAVFVIGCTKQKAWCLKPWWIHQTL